MEPWDVEGRTPSELHLRDLDSNGEAAGLPVGLADDLRGG